MSLRANEWEVVGAEMKRQADAAGMSIEQWRLCNLYWIEDEHGNKVKFCPTPIQWDWMTSMWWFSVVLKARQVRISTVCQLLMLDRTMFNENHTGGVIDKTDEDAKRKLARIKFAYDHLDDRDDPRTAPLGSALKQLIPVRFSNAHEFQFANESKIWASTSMRGGTINTLWATEVGVTAVEFPEKAKEIKKGALNSVHAGNVAIIESTFAGGRVGMFYDMIRLAEQTPDDPAQRLKNQWVRFFYGWQDEPSYEVETFQAPSPSQVAYFEELEKLTGRPVSQAKRNWYVLKAAEQGADMVTEFPGTAEEAMQAIPEGSYYGDQMLVLRATGRICPLVCDGQAPLFTSWDLGERDATAIWLLQIVGPDVHALDFHCANGATPAQHVAHVLGWERQYKRVIATHYIPHDGDQRKAGSSWSGELKKAGLTGIRVVERIAKVMIGITQTRQKLPSFRFNSKTCEKEFPMDDGKTRWPSGVAALEAYRKKAVAVGGNISWEPVHNECESGASALRTFCEAAARGLLIGPSKMEQDSRRSSAGPQRAKMGVSRPGYEPKVRTRAILR